MPQIRIHSTKDIEEKKTDWKNNKKKIRFVFIFVFVAFFSPLQFINCLWCLVSLFAHEFYEWNDNTILMLFNLM